MPTTSFRRWLMNAARASAGLLFLAVLTASASPEPRPEGTSGPEAARLRVPDGPERTAPAGDVVAGSGETLSGGTAGAFLVAAALLSAVAILLAVVIPWPLPLEGGTR